MLFKEQKQESEAFGDFCHRVGAEALEEYSKNYECTEEEQGSSLASAITSAKKSPKVTTKTATVTPKKAQTAVVA